MFRERDTRQLVANHCQCQLQQQTKPKSTIKQFIQLDSNLGRNESFQKRNSRIIELIDTSNRNLANIGVSTPKSNVTLKYPVQKTRSTSIYQPFPTENLYDEINPLEEELTSTYDHLSRPYVPHNNSTYQRLNKINCFRLSDNNRYNNRVVTKENSLRKFKVEPRDSNPPPPPPIKKLPRINRANLNLSLTSRHRSPVPKMNKSLTSAEIQSEQYDKWTHDNSSGYNSSQDLSNHSSSSNSSITSYCSISESVNKQVFADKTNMADSGFSTLHLDDENIYDCTENISNYSNISPSSISSFNSSFSEQEIQPFTSPFPRIKTPMVAQIKRINPIKQSRNNELVYENLRNQNLGKAYSVKDVLFSLKKMELNNKNINLTSPPELKFSPITTNTRPSKISSRQYLNINSTPPRQQNQRNSDDYLCDEEVESILSPKQSYYKKQISVNPSSVYKYSNNRNVAIWEQLV